MNTSLFYLEMSQIFTIFVTTLLLIMAKQEPSNKDKPRKFQHVFKDSDGCESVWKYDLDKFPNGPISVEIKYPPHYEKALKKRQKEAKLERSKSTIELAKEGKLKERKFW